MNRESGKAYTIEDGLYLNTVLSLLSIKSGNMLLGYDRGVQGFDPRKDKPYEVYSESSIQEERITQMFKDSKSRTWFGTFNGVYMDNGDSLIHFTQAEGLAHDNCRTFYEDEFGDIWILTYGGGLSRYHNNQFQSIRVAHGLYSGIVSSMVRDGDRLWMTSNNGLYAASFNAMRFFFNGEVSRINCISFGTEAGLNTNEFNGAYNKSGIKHPNGNLYFSSMNGLVELADSALPYIPTPEIFVNSLALDGVNKRELNKLAIEADVKRVSFQISIPTYAYPNNVLSEYRLAGYNDEWKPIPADKHIDFTNLSAGSYKLELRARSLMSGSSNYNFSSLEFSVLKPWYLNNRLLGIFSLIIIAIIVLWFTSMRFRERKAKVKLEKAIRKRTNELRENQTRLKTVIENTSQLIWSIDKNYNLVTYNRLFAEFAELIYGFEASPGLNLPASTKEKTKDYWLIHFEEAMKGKPVTIETRFSDQGEERVIQTELFPITEAQGAVTGIVGFSTDKTDEVKREMELKDAKVAAEQAARAKADFLATMSHEITTPLNGVIGTTSLLKRENLTKH